MRIMFRRRRVAASTGKPGPRACATVLAGLLGIVACPAAIAQAPTQAFPPERDAIDARIRQRMDEGGIVGAAAAVIVDGRVAWRGGYGYADRQRGIPFTTATVMNIASISKTVTGAAMMRAVEQCRLALDDDVNRYLPFRVVNPHRPGVPVTLRQLATHTSGIVDRWPVYARAYHFGGDAPQPLGAFLADYLVQGGADYASDNFLDAMPGTRREYSNIGAALAGYVVERATGTPLNVYTREQFFRPLGMAHTRWFIAEAPMDDHTTAYTVEDGWALPLPPYGVATWPDGGLRTSVDDLSKFLIALLGGGRAGGVRVLQRASVAEMTRLQWTPAHHPENADPAEKNSGLFWSTKFDVRYVGHGGNDPGVRADMLATPALDAAVVLFTNTTGGDTQKAYVAILQTLLARAESLARARRAAQGDDAHSPVAPVAPAGPVRARAAPPHAR